jgi:hypothetical protein
VATSDPQQLPVEYERDLLTFHENVQAAKETLLLDGSCLWNMDQTMVRFDNPEKRTNNAIGESKISIRTTGATKKGFTVGLCVSANGTKLPAFIIFKERNGRVPPFVRQRLVIPDNLIVEASKNGWMISALLNH